MVVITPERKSTSALFIIGGARVDNDSGQVGHCEVPEPFTYSILYVSV